MAGCLIIGHCRASGGVVGLLEFVRGEGGGVFYLVTCRIISIIANMSKQYNIKQYIQEVQPINSNGKVITRQGVLWRINKGLPLPQVKDIKLIGRQYIITVYP